MFAYTEVEMSSTCQVSFDDGAGMTHTVSVSASSLYEAAVLALAEFKKSGFAFGGVDRDTKLKVAVEAPTTHTRTERSETSGVVGLQRQNASGTSRQGDFTADPQQCLARQQRPGLDQRGYSSRKAGSYS
jgi:hypothetical protein